MGPQALATAPCRLEKTSLQLRETGLFAKSFPLKFPFNPSLGVRGAVTPGNELQHLPFLKKPSPCLPLVDSLIVETLWRPAENGPQSVHNKIADETLPSGTRL